MHVCADVRGSSLHHYHKLQSSYTCLPEAANAGRMKAGQQKLVFVPDPRSNRTIKPETCQVGSFSEPAHVIYDWTRPGRFLIRFKCGESSIGFSCSRLLFYPLLWLRFWPALILTYFNNNNNNNNKYIYI